MGGPNGSRGYGKRGQSRGQRTQPRSRDEDEEKDGEQQVGSFRPEEDGVASQRDSSDEKRGQDDGSAPLFPIAIRQGPRQGQQHRHDSDNPQRIGNPITAGDILPVLTWREGVGQEKGQRAERGGDDGRDQRSQYNCRQIEEGANPCLQFGDGRENPNSHQRAAGSGYRGSQGGQPRNSLLQNPRQVGCQQNRPVTGAK